MAPRFILTYTIPMTDIEQKYGHLPYRKNILLVILRPDGKVLLVSRVDNTEMWQFPQGGVKKGEELENAAMREAAEEIGASRFRILGRSEITHRYLWPEHVIREYYQERFKGQSQTIWFLLFEGTELDIMVNKKELSGHRWVEIDEVPELIDPKRRPLAEKIMDDIRAFREKAMGH